MSGLSFPQNEICKVCSVPAVYSCNCADNPAGFFYYLCEVHLIEHLNREVEHTVAALPENNKKFDIELDEETLENSNISVRGHSRPITSLCLSASFLFTGENGGIYKWSLQDKTLKQRYQVNCQVWSVSLSCDGNLVAGALENQKVVIFDTDTGDLVFYHQHHIEPVLCVNLTRDDEHLVSGSSDGSVVIVNLKTKQFKIIKQHSGPILAMSSTDDGKYVATASADKTVKILDIEKKSVYGEIRGNKHAMTAVQCTSDDTIICTGYEGLIRIWDIQEKKLIKDITMPRKRFFSLAVSNDGTEAIAADQNHWISRFKLNENYQSRKTDIEEDEEMKKRREAFMRRVNDKAERRRKRKGDKDSQENERLKPSPDCIGKILEGREHIMGLCFSEEDDKFYGIIGGRTVRVYRNDESFKRLGEIGHDKLVTVRTTDDDKYVVASYMDGGVRFYDTETGELKHDFNSLFEARELIEKYADLGVYFKDEDFF